MRNRELKKGGKIWLYSPFLRESDYYPVLDVKKKGTLITVVVEARIFGRVYQITMYGHASSSMLSGFDGKVRHTDCTYTCDYDLVQRNTDRLKRSERYEDAGRALLYLVKYFKD